MKNKLFLSLFVVGLISTSLVGCGNNEDNDPSVTPDTINLRFWNGFTGKDGDAMRSIVNEFNKEYKGVIKVKSDSVVWDNLFLKLIQNKGDAEHSPHIAVIPANRISLVRTKGVIKPINSLVDYLGITRDEYIDAAWEIGLVDDVRWSFPLDMHPTLLYYNKDLIDESELPTTWEEFETVIKAKTQNRVYGWAIPSMYSITLDVFMNMLIQKDSDLFEVQDGQYVPVFNSQKCIDILTLLQKWKYTDKVSPTSVGAAGDLTLFNSGKSVFYFDGIYQMNALYETSPINWGATNMPGTMVMGGKGYSGSHQWTLVESTTQDDKIQNACYTFIKYVNEHAVNWAKGGQVPACKSVHEEDEFKAIQPVVTAKNQALVSTMGTMKYDYYYEAYNFVGSAVANTLGNNTDPKVALDNAYAQFQQFLKENQ